MSEMHNTPVNSEDLLYKLSDILFSTEAEQFITVTHKIDSDFRININMEEFRKLSHDEQKKMILAIHESNKNKEKVKKIEFVIGNQSYELRNYLDEGTIFLSHYKEKTEVDYSSLDIPLSKDVETFKADLISISEQFDVKDFEKERESYREKFYENIIASRRFQAISQYINDEALDLMLQLKSLFTIEEQNYIDFLINDKFEPHTNNFKHEIYNYFVNWFEMLQAKKHDVNNQFEFNDLDNYAYYHIDESYLAIIQKSQNTIFAYIYNKKEDQFKVWNCAEISRDYNYEMNYFSTYKDVMMSIGNPYAYYVFSTEMTGPTYPKSPEYYLKHFDDDSEFLVFDSTKGFRINSCYSDCMATDVPLLTSVLSRL